MATEVLSKSYASTLLAHTAATTAKLFYLIQAAVVGLALNDAASGENNVFVYESSMVRVPKATGEAWAMGAKIYYSSANSNFTTTSTSNVLAGIVNEDAATADVEGIIHLTPFA